LQAAGHCLAIPPLGAEVVVPPAPALSQRRAPSTAAAVVHYVSSLSSSGRGTWGRSSSAITRRADTASHAGPTSSSPLDGDFCETCLMGLARPAVLSGAAEAALDALLAPLPPRACPHRITALKTACYLSVLPGDGANARGANSGLPDTATPPLVSWLPRQGATPQYVWAGRWKAWGPAA
jgi:hypothetical protein